VHRRPLQATARRLRRPELARPSLRTAKTRNVVARKPPVVTKRARVRSSDAHEACADRRARAAAWTGLRRAASEADRRRTSRRVACRAGAREERAGPARGREDLT